MKCEYAADDEDGADMVEVADVTGYYYLCTTCKVRQYISPARGRVHDDEVKHLAIEPFEAPVSVAKVEETRATLYLMELLIVAVLTIILYSFFR